MRARFYVISSLFYISHNGTDDSPFCARTRTAVALLRLPGELRRASGASFPAGECGEQADGTVTSLGINYLRAFTYTCTHLFSHTYTYTCTRKQGGMQKAGRLDGAFRLLCCRGTQRRGGWRGIGVEQRMRGTRHRRLASALCSNALAYRCPYAALPAARLRSPLRGASYLLPSVSCSRCALGVIL